MTRLGNPGKYLRNQCSLLSRNKACSCVFTVQYPLNYLDAENLTCLMKHCTVQRDLKVNSKMSVGNSSNTNKYRQFLI